MILLHDHQNTVQNIRLLSKYDIMFNYLPNTKMTCMSPYAFTNDSTNQTVKVLHQKFSINTKKKNFFLLTLSQ